ncbi:MAG: hypothetical protein ACQERB_10680 [Promethearchaeati archaeon]
MLFQSLDFLQTIANIFGTILTYLGPIVSPIGEFMVFWISYALEWFPDDDWTIYIVIFVILIIAGIIINCYWPGDKPPKKGELKEKEPTKEEKTDFKEASSFEDEEPKFETEDDLLTEEDELNSDFDEDLLPEEENNK